MAAACSDCAAPIGVKNRSGRCRSCTAKRNNADPAIVAKRAAAIAARFAQPGVREGYAERARQKNANPTDAMKAAQRERGKAQAPKLAVYAAKMTAATRADNGRKRSATVLAWCPDEWRTTYRRLSRSGMSAAEAKRVTLDLIAGKERVKYAQQRARLAWCPDDRLPEYRRLQKAYGTAEARRMLEADMAIAEKRRLASMTSFERMQEKLSRGVGLIEKPILRRADPTFSLVGNATGML